MLKVLSACDLVFRGRSFLFAFFFLNYLFCNLCIAQSNSRQRISLNEGWKFFRYESINKADSLIYDARPVIAKEKDDRPADSKPTEAVKFSAQFPVLKPYILPTGNRFLKDPAKRYIRPQGDPGINFPFVQATFNDKSWESVNLPHDWAIKGPFYKGGNVEVGGSMGRLPVHGVAWYRRKLFIPMEDKGRSIFFDIDGAMSYAMVWLNGKLVGGWPYGYSSWRVDLTPYIKYGSENQLAIRLDNPPASSRWYPGSGIYRNVWLVKTNPVHVSHWGTKIITTNVSEASATINLQVAIDNDSEDKRNLEADTKIFALDEYGIRLKNPVAAFKRVSVSIGKMMSDTLRSSINIENPRLWGPPPNQKPNCYVAITTLYSAGKEIDVCETIFGIRDLKFDGEKGLLVNGKKVIIKGVNQHHDLGALGAAFNPTAAKRQLDMLKEVGCNAIRMSHNPPAPELLDLCDQMGFLVFDEIFDCWELKKPSLDFHLVFPEWHEQDLRAMIRRDRNHPSVIIWGFGNEVGEQYTGERGASVAKRLYAIAKDEDSTRPLTSSMNFASANMPFPAELDIISLNYQGEGIRWGGLYTGLKGISSPPSFPAFHSKFPEKMILSSENASALSSRGVYLFPVTSQNSAPVRDGAGGDSKSLQVSAYELYSADFGASPDRVFAANDSNPYVAGGFVWTGWDHLGEPTPYYLSRSSYCGLIDLAGFKKDRFYLYQSYWRPDFPMAHILPHWNWPDRTGKITPVHVFTSGDAAELFLNGKSLGMKKKAQYEYRLRWDSVIYSPGQLKVIAYKNGKKWAEDIVKTSGEASRLKLTSDRDFITSDGKDLCFVTVKVEDKAGQIVRNAKNALQFSIAGPGEIVATDNGDPSNLVSFASTERQAFNGLCLIIVRAKPGEIGTIKVEARSSALTFGTVDIKVASGNK